MEPIVNAPVPDPPWRHPKFRGLPGTFPADPDDWLRVSDTYAAQMAERERLLADRPGEVIAGLPGSEDGVAEMYRAVLEILAARDDFSVSETAIRCPDGREVVPGAPLPTLLRLVQEDLCLMEKRGEEYALTAAVLCFPANWMLSEKIGRPLTGIHAPVDSYDEGVAKRVARLFDGVQPGRPLVRVNGLFREDPALHQPESESIRHGPEGRIAGRKFFRSERQCFVRLPETRAVLFTIHTSQWRVADLGDEAEALPAAKV
ncbi:DUF3445 domain-containing protein [Rhodobacterales bacterium HKCCE2091]|nr:DUF3445 domain-containing protein [Rhodobacterales bacterium HKCCE2091]